MEENEMIRRFAEGGAIDVYYRTSPCYEDGFVFVGHDGREVYYSPDELIALGEELIAWGQACAD